MKHGQQNIKTSNYATVYLFLANFTKVVNNINI